jgi:hypothetical protein
MKKLAVAVLLFSTPAMADGTGSGKAVEGGVSNQVGGVNNPAPPAPNPIYECTPIGKTAKGVLVYPIGCKLPKKK